MTFALPLYPGLSSHHPPIWHIGLGWAWAKDRSQLVGRGRHFISAGGCGWDWSQGAARPGRPAAAQRTGGGEGGAAGPAGTSGLRKQPVVTSRAWPSVPGGKNKGRLLHNAPLAEGRNWAQKPGRPPYLMLGCSTYKLPTDPIPGLRRLGDSSTSHPGLTIQGSDHFTWSTAPRGRVLCCSLYRGGDR